MSSARHLTWLVPGWSWDEVVTRAGGKKGKGKKREVVVHREVSPRQFDRSADAYRHARDCGIPFRQVKVKTVRVGS